MLSDILREKANQDYIKADRIEEVEVYHTRVDRIITVIDHNWILGLISQVTIFWLYTLLGYLLLRLI